MTHVACRFTLAGLVLAGAGAWSLLLVDRVLTERDRRLDATLGGLDVVVEAGRGLLATQVQNELAQCRAIAALPPQELEVAARALGREVLRLDPALRPPAGAPAPVEAERALAAQVLAARRPALAMLGPRGTTAAAPAFGGCVVLVRTPPEVWLLPFMSNLPVPARSAVGRLAWREGQDVRWTDTGRGERPTFHTEAPAAPALPVATSLVRPDERGERRGARGVPILVATRQVGVPGGNWGLVVQVDRQEALAGWTGWALRELLVWGVLPLGLVLAGLRRLRAQQQAQALELERARAEARLLDQLRTTQAQLRTAAELSPEGFALLEPVRDAQGAVVDLRYASVNPAGLRILGRGPELVGRCLLEEFPHARDEAFPALAALLERGGSLAREEHYQADGLDGWFRLVAVPTGGGLALSFADITRRKADQALLEARQQELERLVGERTGRIGRLNDYLRVLSELNRFLAQNVPDDLPGPAILGEACRLACRVDGVARASVCELSAEGLPRRLAGHLAGEGRAPAGPCGRECACASALEGQVLVQDGSDVLVPLALGEGRRAVLCLSLRAGLVADDELRELAEKLAGDVGRALQAAETRASLRTTSETLSGLVAASPVIVGILDAEGRVQLWNPAAERILGWSAAEALGKVLPTVTPDKREEFRDLLRGVLSGRPLEGLEVVRQRKDGTPVELRVYSAPLRDPQGEATGVVAIMVDVTAHNRAQAELRATREQLLHAQKLEAVGRLAGGVAHDFNNLLTVIQGYAQMACDRTPPDAPARRQLEQVLRAGTRASELTRQLLAFSRRLPAEPRIVDPGHQVRDMEKMLRRLIGETIELRLEVAADVGEVRVDPGQLEQVLMNLAVNARDAMPQGGRLLLEVAGVDLDEPAARLLEGVSPGRWVRLAVVDTGVGMSPEVRARLFEPFFTTKEQGKGTGLGLATVYGIVEQAGGFLRVESELGRGSRFEVWLPRVHATVRIARAALAPTPGGTESLLVAEDDPTVRELMSELLVRRGYRVRTAADAEEALRLLAADPCDLLLTDLVMPRMSGLELARQARAVRPELAVLYMSGYPREDALGKGVEPPAFLSKPVPEATLLGAVRQALDARPRLAPA